MRNKMAMVRKIFHILLLASLFCLTGCFPEVGPSLKESGMGITLTIRCDDSPKTKADSLGVDRFNENLIKSVDFFFYPGSNPNPDNDAAYHVRKVLSGNVQREEAFNLLIKKNVVGQVFQDENGKKKATVYVLVNFDESFFRDTLSGRTSLHALANGRIETLFAQIEKDYIQPSFLMDGMDILEYKEEEEPSVQKVIQVDRFASKLTMAVHVADTVILKHKFREDDQHQDITEPDEYWTPVLHTMRVYLVDGAQTVKLSRDGETLPDPFAEDTLNLETGFPKYVSYRNNKRPYVENDNITPCVDSIERGGSKYYETYPMYTYPREWSDGKWDYSNVDFKAGQPTEPPYFKLEIDWRRDTINNYSYDLRKYYYKVYLPLDEQAFVRNKWYSFLLDVGILGSETDEGKSLLDPSCYILDWQNKSQDINKSAVISAARYLSVDKEWVLHNIETLSIPFMSSHDVKIVEGSVIATRPYYGQDKPSLDSLYNTDLHAWIKRYSGTEKYYLDYRYQKTEANAKYEPSTWLVPFPTTIEFKHELDNDYSTSKGFDYSPYTIEFDIVHADLGSSDPRFEEYKRHVKITQYPAIYIEAELNSDTRIIPKNGYQKEPYPYGYEGSAPWLDQPWGYVYVNGRDVPYNGTLSPVQVELYNKKTRLVRWDYYKNGSKSKDPFWKLTDDNNRREYQWQTIYYSGGSRDIFNINVTVLPSTSTFVIGDPRCDNVDNLDYDLENPDPRRQALYEGLYQFTNVGTGAMDAILPNRTGFAVAPSLDDPAHPEQTRTLKWYYPTEASSRTRNMLAPSYRIASKFGGTEYGNGQFSDISMSYAQYRCAAFQEDGYPAGRWRLPTRAEIYFIAQLSAKGAFEKLFSNSTYWSANGAIKVNGGSVSDMPDATTALLRCVYDSWYWDSYDDRLQKRDQFVWGDKQR